MQFLIINSMLLDRWKVVSVKNVKDNEVKMLYKSVFTGCSILSIAFFGGHFFQNIFMEFVIIIVYTLHQINVYKLLIVNEMD